MIAADAFGQDPCRNDWVQASPEWPGDQALCMDYASCEALVDDVLAPKHST